MAFHKRLDFSPELNELANLANALSHPARIAILQELAKRNACVCGEIVEVLPLAQSTVSQHLKELRHAGLIEGTVEGVKSCYCINWEAFDRAETILSMFFQKSRQLKKDCCSSSSC